jgi:hypothetical protein
VHAAIGWRPGDPIVDVAAEDYERRLDFPAREASAADRHGRGARRDIVLAAHWNIVVEE